jgi:tetratricopeptide (TPR) repeat protein
MTAREALLASDVAVTQYNGSLRCDMKEELQEAYQYAKRGLYDEALKICDDFISNHPHERKGYKEKASIFARMKRWDNAIETVTILIDSESTEPDDFFSRGRWHLMVENFVAAIKDFTEVIDIEKKTDTTYYTESAYFGRAESNLRLGYYKKAIKDCGEVREGFILHLMGRLRSREDIIHDALKGKGEQRGQALNVEKEGDKEPGLNK